jgi:PD-(D/E)XK nuclease superfamily
MPPLATDMPDIPPQLDRRKLVHSFSSLNQYESCPHRYGEQYYYKRIKWAGNKGTWKGDAAHEALEKRVGQGKALPEEMAHYEPFAQPFDTLPDTVHLRCEHRYGITADGRSCDFFANDVFLRGKVDVSVVTPDFTKAMVTDWKTNKTVWDKPFELEVSALYLKAAHPTLEVVLGSYVWLEHNKLGKQHDLSDFRFTWNKVLTHHAQIQADAKAGAFEKKPGPLCAWCPVKSCEHNRSEKK